MSLCLTGSFAIGNCIPSGRSFASLEFANGSGVRSESSPTQHLVAGTWQRRLTNRPQSCTFLAEIVNLLFSRERPQSCHEKGKMSAVVLYPVSGIENLFHVLRMRDFKEYL